MARASFKKRKLCCGTLFGALTSASIIPPKRARDHNSTIHVKLRGHEADVVLDLEDLKAAKTDMIRRQMVRHKIKARCDHLDKSRYGADVLGLKSARILRAAPKPEAPPQRGGFGRGGPRR